MVTDFKPGNKPGHRIYKFDNGYGASVINDGYGRESGLCEIAVLDSDGHLTYSTPITSGVLGWQTQEEVEAVLTAIESLTPAGIRTGAVRRTRADIEEKRDEIARLEAVFAALEAEALS